jgi:2,3-bisphosphoglycerate-dependent phosphoglycerate mutase
VIDLIAVRHGETDWNRVRRLQGHTDIALNPTGIEQAARLAAALATEPIDAIHSSDLLRAVATAEPVAVALGVPVIRSALLRERNYGVLEGKTFAEILGHYPDEAEALRLRRAGWTIPNGESLETFYRRAVDTVSAIAAGGQRAATSNTPTILIVTHGGVLDMLYRAAFGLALDAERTFAVPNAVINRLTYDDGRFVVRSWAEEPGPVPVA